MRKSISESKEKKRGSRIGKLLCIIAILYVPVIFLTVAIAHGIVMNGFGYEKYDCSKYLLYTDVESQYPRETFRVRSGENALSVYLYGKGNEKGVIIIAPGHGDSNDIKLYETRYFVDAGYEVICFDYTGFFTSEGKHFGGYAQAVYDLDAVLTYVEEQEAFRDTPVYLFGHSLGGYAVCAVLNKGHNVKAVVSTSGFDTPKEQWQCSIKRFTGVMYPLVKPINSLFINLKYGEDQHLSAVEGINAVDIPVLVVSAEDDVFYGGKKSPIYEKKDEIQNENCTFRLMTEENHNHHYDYFLTDAALEYQQENPTGQIDKELYMQHDAEFMKDMIEYFESAGEREE